MSRICLTARQFRESEHMYETLVDVVNDALAHWPEEFMVVTCIYRPREEDKAIGGSGIHSSIPHRAIDLRVKNFEGDFQAKADSVAASLNALWTYDPTRPHLKVAISKLHGSGPHIHLQVHPKTRSVS